MKLNGKDFNNDNGNGKDYTKELLEEMKDKNKDIHCEFIWED